MSVFEELKNLSLEFMPHQYNPILLLNKRLADVEPWEVVARSIITIIGIWLAGRFWWLFRTTDWKKTFFKTLKRIPYVRRKIADELGNTMKDMKKELNDQLSGNPYYEKLPEKGWSKEEILRVLAKIMDLGEFKAERGSLSGTCHKPPNAERVSVVAEAYGLTAFANPLNPDAFPGIRKMEAEVVRMAINLFHGDEKACGTMTSGGTESLILASKAYRDFAAEEKGITKPNIVMSSSGHVGFDKAGHLLGIDIRHVPMDPKTMHPDLQLFERAIDSNTCAVIGSAPQYPQGVMDPIEKIAAIARRKKVPLHIDACLGGFLLAFLDDADPFDFRVDGVTSISADTHKFGYAPKGSSVIMYSDRKYIHHQYYVSADWSGGIFVSPTLAGSRSGGIIAATWAALMNNGMDGYRDMTKKVVDTMMFIKNGISSIDGLRVLGDPKLCIVAFVSTSHVHVFSLADEMKKKGWLLSCLQYPTCIHLYVTPMHTQEGIKERFLFDLKEITNLLMKGPKKNLEGRAAVYGMAQSIPDKSLIAELGAQFIDALYSTK